MTTALDLLITLAWLEEGSCAEEMWGFFDSLEPVSAQELVGQRWRGGEVPTEHPMSGALTVLGWYGKQFDDVNHVHPLLFCDGRGEIFPLEPRFTAMRLAGGMGSLVDSSVVNWALPAVLSVFKPLVRSTRHRARLRDIEYRGVISAAMVYDHRAIVDHFRKVDDATLLGVMDLRGVNEPYFFTLRRDWTCGSPSAR